MAIGILGTGVSGLLSSQRALSTTAQNISNVNTEGYTRQRVDLTSREPSAFGSTFIGTGVKIDSIDRVYDQFLVDQVRSSTSSFNQLSQYYSLSAQVDNIIGDTQAGLMTGLNDFFNAIQTVADDPTSAAARQVMISDGESLVARFDYINERVTDIERAANADIRVVVDDINSLTTSIADINERLSLLRSQSSGEPNDVLDQRDLLLQQLAEKIDIRTLYQDDGSVNVFVGNGQAVVTRFDSMDLSAVKNQYDPSRVDVAYVLGSTAVDITAQLSGGELSGLLQFRNEVTEPVKNSLGLLAIGLSETFNEQHRQGVDFNGELGGNFFTDISASTPEVLGSNNNTGNAVVNAEISDVNALTGSNYTLRYDGANLTLTREKDNVIAYSGPSFPVAPVDGLNFSLGSGGLSAGDSFLVLPVRQAATEISMAITDPEKIAAASPVIASASLSNSGSGEITPGSIVDVNLLDGDRYNMTMTSATAYEIRDSANNLEASGSYASGAAITFNGIEVSVSGAVESGDTFSISPSGVGDNRNMLSLAALQDDHTMKGDSVSFVGLYTQLVVDVGSKTRQAEINMDSQDSLLKMAVSAWESKSGVNLDEEAADLIRYQQLYQASAQVISTADSTFQTLIGIFRR